jgi:hypothetical protein
MVKLLWFKVHPEDPKWMEIHMPPYLVFKKNQRSMVRFSTIKNCYLLLLHLALYEAILMQFEPNKVLIKSAPKRVFTKTKCPQPQTT